MTNQNTTQATDDPTQEHIEMAGNRSAQDFSSGGGNRKVLATGKVLADSLPLVFRHNRPADALDDAKAIAHLLSHAADAFSSYQSEVDAEWYKGLGLIFSLLIDKLDIGSGSYKFPCMGWGDEFPALAEREEVTA